MGVLEGYLGRYRVRRLEIFKWLVPIVIRVLRAQNQKCLDNSEAIYVGGESGEWNGTDHRTWHGSATRICQQQSAELKDLCETLMLSNPKLSPNIVLCLVKNMRVLVWISLYVSKRLPRVQRTWPICLEQVFRSSFYCTYLL